MSLASLPSISAAGWSIPLGNYTPLMRRAVLALERGPADFQPGSGGWAAGDIIIAVETMRALAAREVVAITYPRKKQGRAALTPKGRDTAAAIRRSLATREAA